ncbi:MAG: polyhydroxybutyrate depolymerase, partial [Acidobacteria bacterium]|nr:polyhydroxybutyrate depolymerase [Acidobacteriota bacterium]
MAILFVLPLVLLFGTARAGERLPPLNADITQTSVSGISSGGAMAVQFHVAYSSLVKGAGVLAGVRFACAGNSASNAVRNCTQPDSSHPVPPLNELVSLTDQLVGSGAIDATTHLAGDRVWLFSGTNDAIVKQPVMTGCTSIISTI